MSNQYVSVAFYGIFKSCECDLISECFYVADIEIPVNQKRERPLTCFQCRQSNKIWRVFSLPDVLSDHVIDALSFSLGDQLKIIYSCRWIVARVEHMLGPYNNPIKRKVMYASVVIRFSANFLFFTRIRQHFYGQFPL